MSNSRNKRTDSNQPPVYQFRIEGQLDDHWRDWFGEGFTAQLDDGDTLLTGPVVDQAALHGILKKIRDLGLPLISAVCVRDNQIDASRTDFSDKNSIKTK